MNDNAQRANRGLIATDRHFWVFGAITADLASGNPVLNDDEELDLAYYYKKHDEMLQKRLAELQAKEKAADKESGPEEFGGDYGSSETRGEDPEGQQEQGAAENVGDGEPEAASVPEVPQDGVAQQEQPG
jgi:hypothetical protein